MLACHRRPHRRCRSRPRPAADPAGCRVRQTADHARRDQFRCRPSINLIVPAGTLLGWSSAPAQAGAWGLLDRDETRTIVTAAAQHPTDPLVRHPHRPRRHRRRPTPAPAARIPPARRPPTPAPASPARRAPAPPEPHLHPGRQRHLRPRRGRRSDYTPSRKLKHLIRARTATCDAPGCQAQALNTDLDHTIAVARRSHDQCNLAPRCRTHHRAKQAPDWKVEQLAPGVTRWTLPSGRTHVTTPTRYDT